MCVNVKMVKVGVNQPNVAGEEEERKGRWREGGSRCFSLRGCHTSLVLSQTHEQREIDFRKPPSSDTHRDFMISY